MSTDEKVILIQILKNNIKKEKTVLDIELEKLYEFIDSDKFNKLSDTQKTLIINKSKIMDSYSSILNLRLLELYNNEL